MGCRQNLILKQGSWDLGGRREKRQRIKFTKNRIWG